MTVIDGRALNLEEVTAATTEQLVEAALRWAGYIRVDPNTWSSVSKQAVCDLLLELEQRVAKEGGNADSD